MVAGEDDNSEKLRRRTETLDATDRENWVLRAKERSPRTAAGGRLLPKIVHGTVAVELFTAAETVR